MTIRASPARTASPSATRTSTTTPPIGLAHACLAGVDVEPGRGDVRRRARLVAAVRSSSARAACPSPSADGADELGRLGEQRRAGVAARGRPGGRGSPPAGRGWSAARRCGTRRRHARVRSTASATSGATGGADHLGEQRVELRRRRVADVAAGVDAHARPGRLLVRRELAGAGGDDARLHRRTRAARRRRPGRRGRARRACAPAAMRNWASTRSTPVTCSVTVCSTWMRGLHSMKKCSPRLGRRRGTRPCRR